MVSKEFVLIEDTQGNLYTRSNWSSSKTCNSVALISLFNGLSFRIALTEPNLPFLNRNALYAEAEQYMKPNSNPYIDFDGKSNTLGIYNFNQAKGATGTRYGAAYAMDYAFPNGQKNGYVLSSGQFYLMYKNLSEVNACLNLVGGTPITNGRGYYTSSVRDQYEGTLVYLWATDTCGQTFGRSVADIGWTYFRYSGYFRICSDI